MTHSIAIVDTGPLLAAADDDDREHARCLEQLQRPDLRLIIPTLVIAEVAYFLARRLGAVAEATFLRSLTEFDVEAPLPGEWLRVAELVDQYADFPLGATDASVIVLAERLNTDIVVTLDRRHFGAVTPRHVPALRLLPD